MVYSFGEASALLWAMAIYSIIVTIIAAKLFMYAWKMLDRNLAVLLNVQDTVVDTHSNVIDNKNTLNNQK